MKSKTVQVVAAQEHVYNGRSYNPGDTYPANEEDVLILETHGRIHKIQKIEQAEQPGESPKGRYKRRDMKAETDKT